MSSPEILKDLHFLLDFIDKRIAFMDRDAPIANARRAEAILIRGEVKALLSQHSIKENAK